MTIECETLLSYPPFGGAGVEPATFPEGTLSPCSPASIHSEIISRRQDLEKQFPMLYLLSYTLAGGGTRTRNIRSHVVPPAFAASLFNA